MKTKTDNYALLNELKNKVGLVLDSLDEDSILDGRLTIVLEVEDDIDGPKTSVFVTFED